MTPTPDADPARPTPPRSDVLLDCLVFLTEHFGHARSAEAIRAGLPYDARGMGPALFCEAAERVGLKTRIVRRAPADIPVEVLPAVVILKDNGACVLLEKTAQTVTIFDPADRARKMLDASDLTARGTDSAIFVHPKTAFAESAPTDGSAASHWFWGGVRENKDLYAKAVLTAVLINFFALVSPLFIMNVYDRVIPNNALETGWVLGIGALTVFTFDFVMRVLRGYFIDFAGHKIDILAARRLYDQLLDMKLAARPASSGAFANMLRDFDSVRDFFTSATLTVLADLPFTALFLIVIGLVGGWVAALIVVLICVVVAAGFALQAPLKALVRKSVHSAEVKHGLLVETIQSLETIKAIGADGRLRARYGHHVGDNALWSRHSRFLSALAGNIASFVQQAASILIVLAGMYLVADARMTMGGLIACVMLGGRAIAPIGQIANLMTRYHQAKGALRTLDGIMARPVDRPPQTRFLHRPDLKGKIALDRVRFSYPGASRSGGQRTLDGVSFTIEAGEKVGLIGRIGSGKSTIARLILGLYDPDEGTLLADDTDYRQIDPADLRRNIGYIAQDVVLFSGTVRDNLTAGRPHASEAEILAAARQAGVHDFIAAHPMGYDAPVGEGGAGLSGGQRQAVALARAILSRPAVLVCDEPTNAMDMQAEESFVRHIREQSASKTLILITHRQPLLSLVDRLILIDRGHVVMDGPRESVLAALSASSPAAGGRSA
jgi:ATP-binding cassette subfamily C protein LapB